MPRAKSPLLLLPSREGGDIHEELSQEQWIQCARSQVLQGLSQGFVSFAEPEQRLVFPQYTAQKGLRAE